MVYLFYVLGWKLAQTYHNLCEQIQDFSTAIIEQIYPGQFSQLINSVTGKNIATVEDLSQLVESIYQQVLSNNLSFDSFILTFQIG